MYELVSIETLPAALTSAEVTESVLRDIEARKNEIFDASKKGDVQRARALRIEAKNIRSKVVTICKGEREEALATQKRWVGLEKEICARITPTEAHLQAVEDDWEAEQERIKAEAEKARQEKIQAKINAVSALGFAPDLSAISILDDENWDAYLADLTAQAEAKKLAKGFCIMLAEYGEDCTAEEALAMPEDQRAFRLEQASKAYFERIELARIKAEEEANRLAEEVAQAEAKRVAEEQAKAEAARIAAIEAAEAKAEQDRLAKIEREKMEEARKIAEAQAEEARKALAIAQEQARKDREELESVRAAEAARVAAVRAEEERIEAERVVAEAARVAEENRLAKELADRVTQGAAAVAAMDRAAVIDWANALISVVNDTPRPNVSTESVEDALTDTISALLMALNCLVGEMKEAQP